MKDTKDIKGKKTQRNYAKARLSKFTDIERAIPLIMTTDSTSVYRRTISNETPQAAFIGSNSDKGMIVDFTDKNNVQVYKGTCSIPNSYKITESYKESYKNPDKKNSYIQYGSRWMKHEIVLLPLLWFNGSKEDHERVREWGHNPNLQINHMKLDNLETSDATRLEIVTSYENKKHKSCIREIEGKLMALGYWTHRVKALTAQQAIEINNRAMEFMYEDSFDEEKFLKVLIDADVLYVETTCLIA